MTSTDISLDTATDNSAQADIIETCAARKNWLIGPWFDMLLVANVAWPLMLFMRWNDGFAGHAGLQFWQVYFVTTPHRWITLALVFLDRRRLQQRRTVFIGVLVSVIAACVTVRWATGALTCLLTIDYIWNAWHFAAQHQGIYRIYGRLSSASTGWASTIDRWLLRGFLLYVTMRVAIATWTDAGLQSKFEMVDGLVALIPLVLLLRAAFHFRTIAKGQIAYLASISLLYLGLLWAIHTHRPEIVLSLTTASALFHALEYLSIVSWSVQRRETALEAKPDWLKLLAAEWLVTLLSFLMILGVSGWFLDQQYKQEWLFLNVIAAFLHYAYDGLIWRRGSTSNSALTTRPVGSSLPISA